MAPHWTVALLLMISVFLGIGRASVTCESDGNTQCVDDYKCTTQFHYRLGKVGGCRGNQVCCVIDDISDGSETIPCGENGKNKCVTDDLCRPQVDFRRATGCPRGLICCEVEDDNTLSIEDPL